MCSVRCSTCTARKRCLTKINGYFFSPLYAMHDMLHCAKKKCKEYEKAKRIKMLLYMVASVFLRDVGVIWCISMVMVSIKQLWLCVTVLDSLISLFSYDETLMISCKSFTHNMQLFATLDTIVHVQCDLAITRNTHGSILLLNCLNLFLKIKLVRLV